MKKLISLAAFLCAVGFAQAQTIVLDNFGTGGGGATGAVIATSSWNGFTSQTATTMSVTAFNGTSGAHDDNGWGTTSVNINATGMNYINFTAQRDANHNSTDLVAIQFEDSSLNTKSYNVASTSFASGSMTTVSIPLSNFSNGFDVTSITGWSIGGGDTVTNGPAFGMTFDQLYFSTTAIPEPSTYAAIFGVACLVAAIVRRQKRRTALAA